MDFVREGPSRITKNEPREVFDLVLAIIFGSLQGAAQPVVELALSAARTDGPRSALIASRGVCKLSCPTAPPRGYLDDKIQAT